MSKILEGKIANQHPRRKMNGSVICAKCGLSFDTPETTVFRLKNGAQFLVYSYIHTDRFIYETNSGYSVVYCSDYCRKKHNHRFTK